MTSNAIFFTDIFSFKNIKLYIKRNIVPVEDAKLAFPIVAILNAININKSRMAFMVEATNNQPLFPLKSRTRFTDK